MTKKRFLSKKHSNNNKSSKTNNYSYNDQNNNSNNNNKQNKSGGLKILLNKYLFNIIIRNIENDIDKLYLIITCKKLYTYKYDIVFQNCLSPNIFFNVNLKPPLKFINYGNSLVDVYSRNQVDIFVDLMNRRDLEFQSISLPRYIYNDIQLPLPENLKELKLNQDFHLAHITSFPKSLTSLQISNEKILYAWIDRLPETILKLVFSTSSTFPKILILPKNLTDLRFDDNFTIYPQELPPTLKILHLGNLFIKKMELGFLPNGLEQLLLPRSYNKPIELGVLPFSLESLENLSVANNLTEGYLPPFLKSLHIYQIAKNIPFPHIPSNRLKQFRMSLGKWNSPLPNSIEEILGVDPEEVYLPGDFPNSTKKLIFPGSFNSTFQCGALPINLKELDLGNRFDRPIHSESLPQSITKLSMAGFNQPLEPNTLNLPNLKILHLGKFNQLLKSRYLPDSITELTLGSSFNLELKSNVLPKNLISLTFSNISSPAKYNFPLKKDVLPKGLEILKLPITYNQPFTLGSLPISLKHLYLGGEFNSKLEKETLPPKLSKIYLQNDHYKGDPNLFLPDSCLFLINRNLFW